MMNSQNVEIIQKRDDNILVHIQIQDKEAWDKEYQQDTLLNIILEDYKGGTGEEFPPQILEAWQKQRNEEDIMQMEIKNLVNKYEVGNFVLGSDNLKIPEKIGKPFYNPFSIFVFQKKGKILQVHNFSGIDLKGLENYGPNSAYCNGCINNEDKLFISGGETNDKKLIDKFWKIDLNSYEIDCIKMIPKKSHSMILVPGNFVFIVGGQDKETFYHDIESANGFFGWKPLNKIRIEPALILVNENLYCFDNINSKRSTNDLTFEKTNLNSNEHQWELMHIVMPDIKFDQKFFGVVQKDDDIIFIGGNIDIDEENKNGANERKNFKYNINSNKLEISEIPFIEFNLKEKTLLPYNEKVSYVFPDFNRHYPEIVFFQKNKNKIKLVRYEPIEKSNDLPPAKKNLTFDQPDNNKNLNMPEIKVDDNLIIGDNIQLDSNQPQIEKSNNHIDGEPIMSNLIINKKKENEIDISDNNKNGLISSIEKDIVIQETNLKYDVNINPEIKNSLGNNKKSFINIETVGEEKENEDIKTDQLELLQDKLRSSQIQEKKESQNAELYSQKSQKQENGGNDINNINTIQFSEIQKTQLMNNINDINEKNQIGQEQEQEQEPKKEESKVEIKNENKKEERPKESVLIDDYIPKQKEGYLWYNSGIILGKNKSEIKDSDKKIEGNVNINDKENKEPKIGLDGKIEGNVEVKNSIDINKEIPKAELKGQAKKDNKDKEFILTGIIVGSKEKDPKILKFKSKYDNQEVNIGIPKINPEAEINVNNSNKININLDSNINEIKPDVNIKSSQLKGPTISKNELNLQENPSNLNIDNKVNINFDSNIPNAELNKNQEGVSIQMPNVEFPSTKVELKGNIEDNLNEKEQKIDAKFNSNIPEINVSGTDAKTKTPLRLPGSLNEQDVKPFDINVKNSNLNANVEVKNQNQNNQKEFFKLSGIIFGTDDPNYNKNKNLPSENKSEMDNQKPKLDFNGNIISNNLSIKKEEIKVENQKDINLNIQKNENQEEEQQDILKISGNINGDIIKKSNDIFQIKEEPNNNNNEIKIGIKSEIEENPKELNLNLENNNEIKVESNLKISENALKGKKITLPSVGVKNDNFVSSRVDEGKNSNEINLDIVNMKSTNVGINGQKTGERVGDN